MSEAQNQTDIRIRFSRMRHGILLRYQVGTFLTMDGRPVKIGQVGVSDLIGLTRYVVRPEDVGRTIGVFTALEIKAEKGRSTQEQRNFVSTVIEHGGIAGVVRSPEDVEKLISGFREGS